MDYIEWKKRQITSSNPTREALSKLFVSKEGLNIKGVVLMGIIEDEKGNLYFATFETLR